MTDQQSHEPGVSRDGHPHHKGGGGQKRRPRSAPVEQERPIKITAEQVHRSLVDSARRRSRKQVGKWQRTQRKTEVQDKHDERSVASFRDRFWLSAALTVPTLVWGHTLPDLLGFSAPAFAGAQWIPSVSGTAVFAYGGWPFLQGALREWKKRLPGMMTLVALAISIAFAFSVAVELGFSGSALWEELATLVVVMLVAHWIETRSIANAEGGLKGLAKLLPDRASRVRNGSVEVVTVATLAAGDVVLVRPGARVPADGILKEGESQVSESMLTGESRPVRKRVGDAVIAGSVNLAGAFQFTVTKTGDRTTLAGIVRLVDDAQHARAQDVADRSAFSLTIVAIAAGVLTLVSWLFIQPGDASFAIERMVTVLVIAYPHAFGLTLPLVAGISTTAAARHGLLIRDRRGLEKARELTTVVFDKTGTLTLGEHRVVDIAPIEGLSANSALRLAAAVERESGHPIGRAIHATAVERGLEIPEATDFRSVAGQGVMAIVGDRKFAVGGPNLLQELGADPDHALAAEAISASARGQSTVYLVEDARVIAAFAVADAIRPESLEAIKGLRRLGVEVALMTGDSSFVARSIAKQLGIRRVLAQVLPDDKARRIEELRKLGKRVAMVGDGVNDAPALAAADLGVAIGAGTDVAAEAGDVVLVRSDPRDVPRMVKLARASYRKMRQNLWWAAGYNIVAIPLAAGVLAYWGIVPSPAMGAGLTAACTIIVAINAQLLRRVRL